MSDVMPTVEEALDQLLESESLRIWTALPGTVVAYDQASQTCTVQPLPAGPTGPLPVLAEVPVMFPRGGGASMTWPLAKGDHVLLVFCARAIGQWFHGGRTGAPDSPRHHALTDAIAIPGLFRAGQQLAGLGNKLELREPTGGTIDIGVGAAQGAARTGDAVTLSAAWLLWVSAVASVTGMPTPVTPVFGTISTGSAKTRIA